MIGFILAAVGLDIVTGQLRMTFGFTGLMQGFDFIIAVIGLFGIGEILLSVEEGLSFKGVSSEMNLRVVLDTWKILPRYWRTFARSCLHRVLDGLQARRGDSRFVYELLLRQAFFEKPRSVR